MEEKRTFQRLGSCRTNRVPNLAIYYEPESPEKDSGLIGKIKNFLGKMEDKLFPEDELEKELKAMKEECHDRGSILLTPEKKKENEYSEYISLDGDSDDSLNETMKIEGPVSEKSREEIRRLASDMRSIDSALSMAEANGNIEEVRLLTEQWENKRFLINQHARNPKVRIQRASEKNEQKNVEKSVEKRRGIHPRRSRGRGRERTREQYPDYE